MKQTLCDSPTNQQLHRFVAITITVAALISASLTLPALADEVTVTVYNSDLGVVTETRELRFRKGIDRLRFVDVPSRIDPTSVRFTALNAAKQVRILEQNYQYDLVSPEKLYQRYIDNEIELFANNGEIYTGDLLAYSTSTVTLRERSGQLRIIRLDEIANLRLPELPEGLITRPTLFWKYSSSISGTRTCEVSYQTGGLSWHAEYIANLNEKEDQLSISGWASIENRSGKTYPNAKLKLVAGDIHRARGKIQPMYRGALSAEMATDASFSEKAFFEYHLYTLPRPSTIANNEIKQLELFSPAQAGVAKEYHYRAGVGATNVTVKLRFANSKDNGLGMPLPAGRVRIFKQDSDGSTLLLGEDNIQHTPRDEELLLTVGKVFDLVVKEITADRRSLSKQVTEYDYKITLKNRKDEDVSVFVRRSLGNDWEILQTSHDFKKISAGEIEMLIPVPASKEVTVEFTVRYSR